MIDSRRQELVKIMDALGGLVAPARLYLEHLNKDDRDPLKKPEEEVLTLLQQIKSVLANL